MSKKDKVSLKEFFMQYGIVEDDDVSELRNGGFGSTTR